MKVLRYSKKYRKLTEVENSLLKSIETSSNGYNRTYSLTGKNYRIEFTPEETNRIIIALTQYYEQYKNK